jgi:(4-O-methyl)-D-glucuronate---lignin esterase
MRFSPATVAVILTACSAPSPGIAADPPKPADLPKPMQLTAQEDHKKMLEQLNIKEIRRGADGNPKSANAANLDESKATPYPDLPDPLTFKDGTKVTTAEQWRKRRAEIVEDFDREVYGRVPKETPKVTWAVTETIKEKVGEIDVTTKKLVGKVDNSSYPHVTVEIQLTLTIPMDAPGPVPVIMEFGFVFPRRPGAPGPPRGAGKPWTQQLIEKGWGYAILAPNGVQADTGGRVGGPGGGGAYQGLTTGIIGLCNKGQPRKPDDWGALRAWAWGASRALDYFETDKAVDAKQVGIEGLSRYGKAAIVTMAYDERFAVGFIGSSGAGGAKLHRRDYGEKVENVAGSGEYHWMAGNYIKYAGPLTAKDLPVDAHELVALCAPRPVFISVGSLQVEGGWIDTKGNLLAAVGASPVYELLGKKGLGTTEFPPQETALIDGEVAFRQHAGGHTTGPNWPTFLTWASRYLKAPEKNADRR